MKSFARPFVFLLLTLFFTSCVSLINIQSTPSDARVAVNGRALGKTPLPIQLESNRTYDIAISADGFADWQTRLEVTKPQEVHAVLSELPSPPPPPPAPAPSIPVALTKLSVFVEPVGGMVMIDGRRQGMATAREPVEVVYEDDPTLAEISVTQEGFRNWTRSVALEKRRDNKVFIHLDPAASWHAYTSDAELLRQAVGQVVSATANLPTLRKEAKILVLPIENEGSDQSFNAMIDDAFITTLAQAGFTPAERDDNLLVELAHSHSTWTGFSGAAGTETMTVWGQTLPSQKTQRAPEMTANVPTADQFLAYRILECGLSKIPITEGEPRAEEMLHRRAALRVHVRVIDALTGRVTWAGFLTGNISDEIPVRVSLDLAHPPNSAPRVRQ